LLHGVKCLVINALRKEKHTSHFNLREALDIIAALASPKAFITHIGHQMGRYEEIASSLPSNVTLAYDGLCGEVGETD